MITISPGLAATMTSSLVASMNASFIDVYTGTMPASADMAPTGTLLGTISVNGLAGAALHVVAGTTTVSKASEPWIIKPTAAGTAGWFRWRKSGDSGGVSGTAFRIDGSIGTNDNPGDMIWDNLVMAVGQPYTIDSFVYSITPVGN